MPAKEKIVSLFEPHTQIIVRYKAGKTVEFGRKLWLEEVDAGIISGYRVLAEPEQDYAHFAVSIADNQRRFGKVPDLVAGDQGVSAPKNDRPTHDAR